MSEVAAENPAFSGWRAFFWPVHNHELKKLFPMLLIFFLLSFDYNVLRTLKDTLVVTAESSGAEVIPFIKVWVMFPGSILLTFLFTRLTNRLKRENVFYVMLAIFLVYFFIFAFVLYPARDFLHPNATADALQSTLPLGLKGFIAMFRNWTFTLFYVMSELWGNIILFLLFWGFANQVTRINEAKRFYGLFGIGANFSGVFAGQASVMLCSQEYNPNLPFGEDAWGQSLVMLTILVLIAGFMAIGIFRWINTKVLTDPRYYDASAVKKDKEVKMRLSIRDSFAHLMRSKYLMSIAFIVIAYNIVINLVEVVWKHEINALYPLPSDYNWYMNQITTLTGVLATLTAMFISGNSIRKCGWTFTAMLTPVVLLITSVGFFGFFFLKPVLSNQTIPFLDMAPLGIVVFFGSAQNIFSRAAKYTVFDSTKEMAFVPLSSDCKIKGKAAIDGVCNRLGKSGGSVIHQSLLLTFSTITASAPYVAGVLLGVIVVWMIAVRVLGRQFTTLTAPEEELSIARPAVVTEPLIGDGVLQEQRA